MDDSSVTRRLYGALHISVRGIRGVRAGHAKPVSINFVFAGDGKSIPVYTEGLATSIEPQTLIFTCWASASDTVRLSIVARSGDRNGRGHGDVATGSVEVPIEAVLDRAPRKTTSTWHIAVDNTGDEIAEVMMFMRWQTMDARMAPRPLVNAAAEVQERGPHGNWMPLSSTYETMKTWYCQVASTPVAAPVANTAERIVADGYHILVTKVGSDSLDHDNSNGSQSDGAAAARSGKDYAGEVNQCVKNALGKADIALLAAFDAVIDLGSGCLGWAADSIEYYKVGTASNVQKLMDFAHAPFRSQPDELTGNSDHGSYSDTSDEAEKAAGSPLRRGISANGIHSK